MERGEARKSWVVPGVLGVLGLRTHIREKMNYPPLACAYARAKDMEHLEHLEQPAEILGFLFHVSWFNT